jgi:hypothetical protein
LVVPRAGAEGQVVDEIVEEFEPMFVDELGLFTEDLVDAVECDGRSCNHKYKTWGVFSLVTTASQYLSNRK